MGGGDGWVTTYWFMDLYFTKKWVGVCIFPSLPSLRSLSNPSESPFDLGVSRLFFIHTHQKYISKMTFQKYMSKMTPCSNTKPKYPLGGFTDAFG